MYRKELCGELLSVRSQDEPHLEDEHARWVQMGAYVIVVFVCGGGDGLRVERVMGPCPLQQHGGASSCCCCCCCCCCPVLFLFVAFQRVTQELPPVSYVTHCLPFPLLRFPRPRPAGTMAPSAQASCSRETGASAALTRSLR
jgi:hypothetical protein